MFESQSEGLVRRTPHLNPLDCKSLLQYHEDKRRAYTLQVEDAIRHGVIEEVKNEFPQVKQATAMHRTTGSMGRT